MIDNATLEADSPSSRSKMIFVVDDDRLACRELAGYLRCQGYFVTEIHDGITAITEIEEHQPALVVMDVRMPFCDGIRAADLAGTLSPSTAVMLMSGFPDEVVRDLERLATLPGSRTKGGHAQSMAAADRLSGSQHGRHPSAERRATLLALSHWNAAHAGDGVPEISAIVTRDRDLARHEFLIKLDARSGQGVFIGCGEGVSFGRDGKVVGRAVLDAVPGRLGDLFSDACVTARSTLRPVDRESEPASTGDTGFRYRAIFLPVRSLSGDADFIFGAFSSKGLDASLPPT